MEVCCACRLSDIRWLWSVAFIAKVTQLAFMTTAELQKMQKYDSVNRVSNARKKSKATLKLSLGLPVK